MAFTDRELEAIHKALDPLCSRVSEHLRDRVRVGYDIDRLSVVVFEEWPDRHDPSGWFRLPSARFRYYRSRGEWELYWRRADLKWYLYEPAIPARRLSTLVRRVDQDEYGCFFG